MYPFTSDILADHDTGFTLAFSGVHELTRSQILIVLELRFDVRPPGGWVQNKEVL